MRSMKVVFSIIFASMIHAKCDDSTSLLGLIEETRRLGRGKSEDKKRSQRSNKGDGDNDDDDNTWQQNDRPLYHNNCYETDEPFNVENKNLILRCLEVSSKRYACSWPDVRRNCPCSCRRYVDDSYDYDDVYNYGDTNDEETQVCSNVNHPFTIFKNYDKVLVYCSDLAKQEYRYACERDRPKKKCPVTCNACNPTDDNIYIYNDDNPNINESSCIDNTNQFPITKNGKEISIRCFNLLQEKYSYACKWKKVQNKCPITCGLCSPEGNNNGNEVVQSCHDITRKFQITKNGEEISIHCFNLLQDEFRFACKRTNVKYKCPVTCGTCSPIGNNDGNSYDDYIHTYKDDDYTHSYKDDDYGGGYNRGQQIHGNPNNYYIFSDDDFNIIYIDDQLY